jgi:hypothetical protein
MSYDPRSLARFCRKLRLENGKPLALEPPQREILTDHFGEAIELTVLIPKKNYKTTTLGALGLFHLREVQDALVPVVASTRDQAGYLYRQAEGLIRRSGVKDDKRKDTYALDGFTYQVRPGFGIREIRCLETRGLLKVYPAEAGAVDGVIPTLGLMDEMHRQISGDLYGVISDALDARDGRMVTISTAGADETSVLGVMRQRFHDIGGTMVGRHLRVQEGSDVFHEWALLPEDDPENLRHVKAANPARIQTIGKLERRRHSKGMTTGRWLRFACNIWTAGEEPEILSQDWDPLYADIGGIDDGDTVILAPSVGSNAAVGIASMRPDGKVAIRCEHLERTSASILARTENLIVGLCQRYRVAQVLDPGYGMQRSMELLEARGVPVESHPYSTARQIAATGTFDRYLRDRALIHDGDRKTRAHVLSAIKKTGTNGAHYVASDDSRAILALAMAVHAVTAMSPTPKIHVYRGA